MIKILENLYMFESHTISSNSYLILGEEIVLVDTGMESNVQNVAKEIESGRIKLSDISLIVNTHCHLDHIGGNHFFKERSNAELAAFEPDASYIKSANSEYTLSLDLKPIEIERILKEKDKIADFEVVHTPGHTPGSISLYCKKKKILICGDLLFADGNIGRYDLRGGNFQQLLNSIRKISEFDIEKILPGHMQACLQNGNEIIQKALNYNFGQSMNY